MIHKEAHSHGYDIGFMGHITRMNEPYIRMSHVTYKNMSHT